MIKQTSVPPPSTTRLSITSRLLFWLFSSTPGYLKLCNFGARTIISLRYTVISHERQPKKNAAAEDLSFNNAGIIVTTNVRVYPRIASYNVIYRNAVFYNFHPTCLIENLYRDVRRIVCLYNPLIPLRLPGKIPIVCCVASVRSIRTVDRHFRV